MKTTSLASLFVMALVSGCGHFANTEKDFLCGAETGQPCRSMADVDGASLLGAGSVAENPTDTNNKQITEEPLSAGGKMTVSRAVTVGAASYESGRYRIPEKIGRFWVAPYLGADHILYEGTNVHFVIQQASWGSR